MIRSKRGVIKRYNAIINQCRKDAKGGLTYGLDFPTIRAIWPERYNEIKELKKLYKELPE